MKPVSLEEKIKLYIIVLGLLTIVQFGIFIFFVNKSNDDFERIWLKSSYDRQKVCERVMVLEKNSTGSASSCNFYPPQEMP